MEHRRGASTWRSTLAPSVTRRWLHRPSTRCVGSSSPAQRILRAMACHLIRARCATPMRSFCGQRRATGPSSTPGDIIQRRGAGNLAGFHVAPARCQPAGIESGSAAFSPIRSHPMSEHGALRIIARQTPNFRPSGQRNLPSAASAAAHARLHRDDARNPRRVAARAARGDADPTPGGKKVERHR